MTIRPNINSTFRFIDDVLSLNNFDSVINCISSIHMILKKTFYCQSKVYFWPSPWNRHNEEYCFCVNIWTGGYPIRVIRNFKLTHSQRNIMAAIMKCVIHMTFYFEWLQTFFLYKLVILWFRDWRWYLGFYHGAINEHEWPTHPEHVVSFFSLVAFFYLFYDSSTVVQHVLLCVFTSLFCALMSVTISVYKLCVRYVSNPSCL